MTDGSYPDLEDLQSIFNEENWKETLPSSLPYSWLLGLARDIRLAEQAETRKSLKRPLYVVCCIMGARAQAKQLEIKSIPDELLEDLLRAYEHLLHREIASRAIGINAPDDNEIFVDIFDHLLLQEYQEDSADPLHEPRGSESP